MEFVVGNWPTTWYGSKVERFEQACNGVLAREMSAYRLVGGRIIEITSEEEVREIELALETSDSMSPVRTHLSRALALLSDRKDPDYRNSIKESISGVEAFCKLISGSSKITLTEALKALESSIKLHPALKLAFNSLYGYTSDAGGIRHALMDEQKLTADDARFMLVSCSAFINFLVSKMQRAGLKLG